MSLPFANKNSCISRHQIKCGNIFNNCSQANVKRLFDISIQSISTNVSQYFLGNHLALKPGQKFNSSNPRLVREPNPYRRIVKIKSTEFYRLNITSLAAPHEFRGNTWI